MRVLVMWVALAVLPTPPARGRPKAAPIKRWATLLAVARERRRQGKRATWRSIWKVLEGKAAFGLVREFACALKRRARLRAKQRREAARIHLTVLAGNKVWGSDATWLGKDDTGTRVVAENVVDLGTRELVDVSLGASVSGNTVVAALERGRKERATLPWVLMTDRGSENTCDETRSYLRANKVVHLLNVPRTPEHNAHCERSHGTLKASLGIEGCSKGLVLARAEWSDRVQEARAFLNDGLPREHLKGRTPTEYAAELPPWYDAVDRDAFYDACCAAAEAAVLGVEDAHDRYLKEREAILSTMEQFNLIRRTRGDALLPATIPEGIS